MELRQDFCDRFLGITAGCTKLQFVLIGDIESHDAYDTFSIGRFISFDESDGGIELFCKCCKHGSRSGVESRSVGDNNCFGYNGLYTFLYSFFAALACQLIFDGDCHESSLTALGKALGFFNRFDQLSVGEDDLCHQAFGMSRNIVYVKSDQCVSCHDLLTLFDMRLKTL